VTGCGIIAGEGNYSEKSGCKGTERVVGGENNGFQHKKMRESGQGMNREKKIIMKKLILQE
jgi:hypothetical protein